MTGLTKFLRSRKAVKNYAPSWSPATPVPNNVKQTKSWDQNGLKEGGVRVQRSDKRGGERGSDRGGERGSEGGDRSGRDRRGKDGRKRESELKNSDEGDQKIKGDFICHAYIIKCSQLLICDWSILFASFECFVSVQYSMAKYFVSFN